jgi:hypothetical protein
VPAARHGRTSFWEWKRRFQTRGFDGLKDLLPMHKIHPQTPPPEGVETIKAHRTAARLERGDRPKSAQLGGETEEAEEPRLRSRLLVRRDPDRFGLRHRAA